MKPLSVLHLLLFVFLVWAGRAPAQSGIDDVLSSTERIVQSTLFSPSLAWVGERPPSESESRAVWNLISDPTNQPVYSLIQDFIAAHPESPWSPALASHMAKLHRSQGRNTLALREWEQAWAGAKFFTNHTSRGVAEFTVAHWSQLLASLGRTETLTELFKEAANWKWENAEYFAVFAQSRDGYETMLNYPGVSYRCGSFALTRVAQALGNTNAATFKMIDLASPSNGFCMSQLVDLSESNKIGLVAVERQSGSEVVVPSVVHWRQNHYAAILGQKDSLYWVVDPTFGRGRWLEGDFVNEEASGKFLIPATNVPPGWKLLAKADTDKVFGKGQPSTIHFWADRGCNMSPGGAGAPTSGAVNPGGNSAVCPPCQDNDHSQDIIASPDNSTLDEISGMGMPVWWVSEPYINLFVADAPLNYRLSDGKTWSLRWTYKQRDAYPLDPAFFAFPVALSRGTGMTNASWTHNFLSYIRFRDTSWDARANRCGTELNYSEYEAIVFLPGGGILDFSHNPPFGSSLTDGASGMRLEPLAGAAPTLGGSSCNDPSSTAGFRLVYPDGSQDIYNSASRRSTQCNSFGGVTTFGFSEAVAYLTQRIDPQGRTNALCYETFFVTNGMQVLSYFRIKQIVDSDGRTNSFSYTNSSFPDFPTKITDPYGRSAYFNPDSLGRMSTLVDTASLTSTISYQNNSEGIITGIATPYGNTTFTHHDDTTFQNTTNQGNSGGHDRINRYISVVDRDNSREVFMYRYESPSRPESYDTSEVPSVTGHTFDNGGTGLPTSLRFRNSYHWGKKQMSMVSTIAPANFTSADYLYARLRHWLDQNPTASDVGTLVSDRISLERAPSLDGTNEGFKTWFDYENKPSNYRIGPSALISTIAQVLPDATTRYTKYEYQGTPFVRVRTTTFTYLGSDTTRGENFTYAANGIDLVAHGIVGGPVERFFWNSAHQLTIYTNMVDEKTTLGYSGSRLASITRPNNTTTTFAYANDALPLTNPNYRMVSSISDSPSGRVIYFPAWTNGLPQRVIAERGLDITNTWDAFNRLTRQHYSDGTFISNGFQRLDLSATKDRLDHWTFIGYDSMRRMTAVTNANTNITQYVYCGCGALQSITDATLTNTTTLKYDAQMRMTNVLKADGTSLTYGYDSLGRRTSATDGTHAWTFTHNNQNLLATVSSSFGQVQRILYDERDRPVQVTDAAGVTVTNTFDTVSRLLSRTWPDNGVERFAYNTNGIAFHTNQLSDLTRYLYDSSGRLSAITNANLEATRFTYNQWSDLLELIDGKNQTNKWNYDVFGRATNKVDASGQTVFGFSYDANNRLTNRWTPAKGGINTAFTYDPVGNVRTITYPNSTNIAYTYDPLNRVKQMSDAIGNTTFAYTRVGQLASEDGPWANDTVANTYSKLLRTSSTLDTWATAYAYDAARRLSSLSNSAGNFSYQFVGASHLRSQLTFPSGASISDTYDHVAQLTNTTLHNSSAAVLNAHSYTYDQWGQRGLMRATDNSRTEYGYDKIGQLKAATPYDANNRLITAQRISYGYDDAGNLSHRTNDLAVRNFVTDKLNQLTSLAFASPLSVSGVTTTNATNVTVNGIVATLNVDGSYSATVPTGNGTNTLAAIGFEKYGRQATSIVSVASGALQYDANGNMLFDGKRGFTWDDENQLAAITQTNAWKSEFIHDGFGRWRIRKEFTWTNSAWNLTNEIRYVYDQMLILQERDSNNAAKITYTRGLDLSGGMQRGGGIGGLLARTDGSGSAYYHADANGNITALIDSSQSSVANHSYDPFGNVISSSGPMAGINEMQFSSMPRHSQSGLNLYAFRAYSPNLQRWTQRDPIGFAGGFNQHRFVGNTPVNAVDPFGLESFEMLDFTTDFSDPAFSQAYGDAFVWLWEQFKSLQEQDYGTAPNGQKNLGGVPPIFNMGGRGLEKLGKGCQKLWRWLRSPNVEKAAAKTAAEAVSPAVRNAMKNGGIEKLSQAEREAAAQWYEKVAKTTKSEPGKALNEARAKYAREGGTPPGDIGNFK